MQPAASGLFDRPATELVPCRQATHSAADGDQARLRSTTAHASTSNCLIQTKMSDWKQRPQEQALERNGAQERIGQINHFFTGFAGEFDLSLNYCVPATCPSLKSRGVTAAVLHLSSVHNILGLGIRLLFSTIERRYGYL